MPATDWISAERPPTAREQSLWARAERARARATLGAQLARIQNVQIALTYQFAAQHGIAMDEKELPTLEQRLNVALDKIDFLARAACDVNRWKLGVSPSGSDLDIVNPHESSMSGVWIPIAIGAVVVAGIIARWAYLEKEIVAISARYNGILHWSDMFLCSDPKSATCIEWREKKLSGGYQKNETLIDSIKSSIKTVGGGLSRGLGVGLAVLIPILALLYLPRPRRQKRG